MRILSKETINETPFLEFNRINYVNKVGKPCKWYSVSRKGGTRAVCIVAYMHTTKGVKLVVTKEFRVPIGGEEWGFPAGLIDGDESVQTTARRELKEETGLDVAEILEVSPFVYNSAGLTDEAICMVFVEACGTPSEEFLESSEEIQTYLMGQDEVEEILNNPDIMLGAKSWIVMKQFAKYGTIC